MDAPVVEWVVDRSDEGWAGEGRLYYDPVLLVREPALHFEPKDPGFVKFAEALFRLLRRRAPMITVGERRVRAGAGAARRLASGELWL